MGLAVDTNNPFGLVGVGYAINEASMMTLNSTYPNLPVAMKESDLINTMAYSLWLNDLHADTGSILFGGIDTEKYKGELKVLDIVPDRQTSVYFHFSVPMTGLHAVSPSGNDVLTSKMLPFPAVLDSGTTLTYLPQDICELVWDEVGAVYVPEADAAMVGTP